MNDQQKLQKLYQKLQNFLCMQIWITFLLYIACGEVQGEFVSDRQSWDSKESLPRRAATLSVKSYNKKEF